MEDVLHRSSLVVCPKINQFISSISCQERKTLTGLQSRLHKDTSSDDDSDYANESTKISTTMKWIVLSDNFDEEKFTCQRACQQHAKRSAKCLINCRKTEALKKNESRILHLLKTRVNLFFCPIYR